MYTWRKKNENVHRKRRFIQLLIQENPTNSQNRMKDVTFKSRFIQVLISENSTKSQNIMKDIVTLKKETILSRIKISTFCK